MAAPGCAPQAVRTGPTKRARGSKMTESGVKGTQSESWMEEKRLQVAATKFRHLKNNALCPIIRGAEPSGKSPGSKRTPPKKASIKRLVQKVIGELVNRRFLYGHKY